MNSDLIIKQYKTFVFNMSSINASLWASSFVSDTSGGCGFIELYIC